MAFPLISILGLIGRSFSPGRLVVRAMGNLGQGLISAAGQTAGIQIRVSTNIPDVMKQLDQLRDDLVRKATVSAVNKTMAQARTRMSRRIRDEFNVSAATVNDQLKVTKAGGSQLVMRSGSVGIEASLEVPQKRRRSLNLIHFDARQTSKGVSFRVKKGGGRKLVPGAFIANQGRTVFVRVDKRRLPIKALQTIDVGQMFNTKRVNGDVVEFVRKKYPEVFEHEASYYVERFNKKSEARIVIR